jgi:DNA-binding transcriptional LysR family regulator
MDRLESMSILLAAVEAGSLSGAARQLRTPLATVSRKVSELETHLKTRLFNRSSRRLVLTDAGQSYVAACRRILEQVDEAERVAAGEYRAPQGSLVITAPIVFGRLHVLPLVIEFLRAHPAIDVRLALVDHLVNLLDEPVDLAVRIGVLPDSTLVATRVGGMRRVVCGSPAYFAQHGRPDAPAALATHECISFQGLTSPETWLFAAGEAQTSVHVRSRLVVTTAEAAIDAAVAGLGITRVLAYQAADAVQRRLLDVVLEPFEPPPAPVHLVYLGGGLLPLKLRAFLDFAAPRLKARLAEIAALRSG